VAHWVVAMLGGRYPAGLGIDLDAGETEVERWFVAATFVRHPLQCVSRNGRSACWRQPGWPGSTQRRARDEGLAGLAAACGLDGRDLESGLVRLDLAHGRAMAGCPGGQACTVLRQPVP